MCNHREYVRTDRNGTKIYHDYTCPRCEGTGIYIVAIENGVPRPSRVDHGICYKCQGTGKVEKPRIIREYTPEYEAKLAERRAKKNEEKSEAKAEQITQTPKVVTYHTYKITFKQADGTIKEQYEYGHVGMNGTDALESFYNTLFGKKVEILEFKKYCDNYD